MTFRWLVAVANWLDARFPPKVVVTQALFDGLSERVHRLAKENATQAGDIMVLRERVNALEKTVAAVKDGIAKGDIGVALGDRAKLREAFVSGTWPAPGSPDAKAAAVAAAGPGGA